MHVLTINSKTVVKAHENMGYLTVWVNLMCTYVGIEYQPTLQAVSLLVECTELADPDSGIYSTVLHLFSDIITTTCSMICTFMS